MEHKNAIHS